MFSLDCSVSRFFGNSETLRVLADLIAVMHERVVSFTCRMRFDPQGAESAGIAVVQATNRQIHLQLARENGGRKLQLLLFTADYALPGMIRSGRFGKRIIRCEILYQPAVFAMWICLPSTAFLII